VNAVPVLPVSRPQGRDQRVFTIGTSDSQIAGPNLRRRALLIGAPLPLSAPTKADGALSAGADSSVAGPYAVYTVAAGAVATLVSATMFETTGTTVVAALQLIRGATTINLGSVTKAGTISLSLPLLAGDVVQWLVTTTVALSVTDFSVNVSLAQAGPRVTVSFLGQAVLDQGLTLYAGTLPLYLHDEYFGAAIREEVHAIASATGVQVPVLDVFDF
jgi:hypothetical protein